MLIHSAGGEVRLMKMHVFPKLFHLHQMIHPLLLLSNNITRLKAHLLSVHDQVGERSTKLLSGSSAVLSSFSKMLGLHLALCRLGEEHREIGELL